MNKKADEVLLYHSVFSLIILAFLLAAVVYFISAKSSSGVMPQVLSKQLCMVSLTDNNTIQVKSEFIIEKQQNNIVVKKSVYDPGYFYPCYSNFTIEKEKNRTIIKT